MHFLTKKFPSWGLRLMAVFLFMANDSQWKTQFSAISTNETIQKPPDKTLHFGTRALILSFFFLNPVCVLLSNKLERNLWENLWIKWGWRGPRDDYMKTHKATPQATRQCQTLKTAVSSTLFFPNCTSTSPLRPCTFGSSFISLSLSRQVTFCGR